MEYLSIIYRFHWKCVDKENYSSITKNSEGQLKSVFELGKKEYHSIHQNDPYYLEFPEEPERPPAYLQFELFGVEPKTWEDKKNIENYLNEYNKWCWKLAAHRPYRNMGKNSIIKLIQIKLRRVKRLPPKCYYDFLSEYRKIWSQTDTENESLENLMIYCKMFDSCVNNLEVDRYYRSLQEEDEEYKERLRWREEERKIIDDSYKDAGGGDEWSDPF